MQQRTNRAFSLASAAMIAALYTVLTLLAALWGLAYGPVQFRFSEALTILPVFTFSAIPGLTVGCFLANLFSGYSTDMVVGTAATLIAAVGTRLLRNIRWRGLPVLAPLPPVLVNAVFVGAEIVILSPGGFAWAEFLTQAVSVGLGELAVCYGLGLPLAAWIGSSKAMKKLFL
ncbi:QueT transporter family protein [Caproiciproducens sp. NJN-50]|uniref:QueT transporter family protein n=1 Tax=Acutalibacteraceae TaxID=3082771 RepID=UPI000FFDFA2D|nr:MULTISPECIES: QueT transporter family protein [Acutalibacteraceae]QAT51068.1 QueT transporter family protein [Caproiciproducens sp. NJN-50]